MRGKFNFPLVLSMFFLCGCCHSDNFQDGPGARTRPPLEIPKPAPVALAGAGNAAFCDVVPRRLERIPVGTVIGREAPKDWTNLVLFATPTLSDEDVRD